MRVKLTNLVPYEMAKTLKHKDFNLYCSLCYATKSGIEFVKHRYDNLFETREGNVYDVDTCEFDDEELKYFIYAPSIGQVLDWLQNYQKYFINLIIENNSHKPITYSIYDISDGIKCIYQNNGEHFTIEDSNTAYLKGIEHVLKLLS